MGLCRAWPTLVRTTARRGAGKFQHGARAHTPLFNLRDLDRGTRALAHIAATSACGDPVDLIGTPHHDNHAWFSFAVSPSPVTKPVMVAVLDGLGDMGAISLYVVERGRMRLLYRNDSVFDSLGIFYAVISSTQGGWTWLSSEGRYMGATAYGNNDRKSNPYYAALKDIFRLQPEGRSLSQSRSRELAARYSARALHRRAQAHPRRADRARRHVESGRGAARRGHQAQGEHAEPPRHGRGNATGVRGRAQSTSSSTSSRHRQRQTGAHRRHRAQRARAICGCSSVSTKISTGASSAAGRLHLWVPPVPNDAGVTMGAAYMGAYLAGFGIGEPVEHAFYCGMPPTEHEIRAALGASPDVEWIELVRRSTATARALYADFMAYMTAQDAIFALYQGAAETGPRALGHRSILANPCNPHTRENLNARVKYREAIRPLAPMMTLEAAKEFFELSEGASDADYNAYNYMVLTAHAKPRARTLFHPSCMPTAPAACRSCARDRSAHLRLPEGARPPHRRRGRGQHLVQCRGPDRADAGAGARHAAPLQGARCGADVFRGRGGLRRAAFRQRARRRPLPRLAQGLAGGNGAAPGALSRASLKRRDARSRSAGRADCPAACRRN